VAVISHQSILESGRYRDLSLDGVDPEVVTRLYRFMVRLRRCEEALIEEYHPADEMRCPVHFCVGQEAAPAALSVLLNTDDYLFSHHRSHGYLLAKRGDLRSLFAELYGRETGANGGKAGSQDISMPALNFYSGAILSGAVGIAVGAGLGLGMEGRRRVAVAGFGEGATDEGVFWEAINYAAVSKLPVVFVCENNRYATYSDQLKRQPADNISQRVETFGVRSHALFGNDVIAVYQVIGEAIEYVRSGQGPYLVEAYTQRWCGHVGPEGDAAVGYRSESELEFWKANCPISLLEEKMTASGLLSPATRETMTREIDEEIADAFRFAKESPFPRVAVWEAVNYSAASPLADALLIDAEAGNFDESQSDAVPQPY